MKVVLKQACMLCLKEYHKISEHLHHFKDEFFCCKPCVNVLIERELDDICNECEYDSEYDSELEVVNEIVHQCSSDVPTEK